MIPLALLDAISNKKCVAFIGSGVSRKCYPSWSKLIIDLCNYCGIVCGDIQNDPRKLPVYAQSAKDNNETKYYEFLSSRFACDIEMYPAIYDVLLKLKFSCYLTLNFDPLLAHKVSMVSDDDIDNTVNCYPALDRIRMSKRSIHHLHGFIPVGSRQGKYKIVLSENEYKEAYREGSNLMNFLVPTLENDTIVFIGCSLRERAIQQAIAISKKNQQVRQLANIESGHPKGDPPKRYIFLQQQVDGTNSAIEKNGNADSNLKEENTFYRDMNIEPIWYQGKDGDHSDLQEISPDLVDEDFSSGVFSHSVHELNAGDYVGYEC